MHVVLNCMDKNHRNKTKIPIFFYENFAHMKACSVKPWSDKDLASSFLCWFNPGLMVPLGTTYVLRKRIHSCEVNQLFQSMNLL